MPEPLQCVGDCQTFVQLPELRRRPAVQVVDFEHVGRYEGVQSIEFLAFRELFREHDLANLLFYAHWDSRRQRVSGSKRVGFSFGIECFLLNIESSKTGLELVAAACSNFASFFLNE